MMLIDNFSASLISVLECPLSHAPLRVEGNDLVASSTIIWKGGDFRCSPTFSSFPIWRKGQDSYEKYFSSYLTALTEEELHSVDEETREIYDQINLSGRVLDVGGGFGMAGVQARVDPDNYISIDPIVCLWRQLDASSAFARHYQTAASFVRIPGVAEKLPFVNRSFDTVHMRSCIDHFADPQTALLEARRVLKGSGKLVIGTSLEHAIKLTGNAFRDGVKKLVKCSLIGDIYERLFDHHMFHPTEKSMKGLLLKSGFRINKLIWQQGYFNVIYIEAAPAQFSPSPSSLPAF